MIAQVLDAPRKPRKSFITNEVTLVFLDFLCTSVTCTLKRISISGFGNYNTSKHNFYVIFHHLLMLRYKLKKVKLCIHKV